MVFAVPVMMGMATYKDIEELYLEDFIIMNEILMVKNENERRANDSAQKA